MKRLFNVLFGVVLVLAVWQASIWIFDFRSFILPSPADVWSATQRNWTWLLRETWPTLQAILMGFGLSVIMGVPLAILLASSRRLEDLVSPLLVFTQTVPKVAIAPLFLIWFGFGMTPKVLIAFLIAFFPIVIDSTVGLKSVPRDMQDLVSSTGASWGRGLIKARLPYALPHIFSGMKLAITFATIGAIVAEFVGTSEGLGYVIQIANGRLDTPLVFAAVIILSLLGLVLFQLIAWIERLAIPWHQSQQ
jgi:NitT/TauT family transport system permease protein